MAVYIIAKLDQKGGGSFKLLDAADLDTSADNVILYIDNSGDVQELALGADGTFLQSEGAAAAPTFGALVVGDIPSKNAASGICQLDANSRVDPTQTAEKSIAITVEDPAADEDITIHRFNVAVTITKIIGVLVGYTSVTINPKHHTDRNNAGTGVLSAAAAVTSTTTGDNVSLAGGDATIPADSFLWLETTAKTGTSGQLHLTFFYTED